MGKYTNGNSYKELLEKILRPLKTEGEGWSFMEDNPGTNNSLSKLKDLF